MFTERTVLYGTSLIIINIRFDLLFMSIEYKGLKIYLYTVYYCIYEYKK